MPDLFVPRADRPARHPRPHAPRVSPPTPAAPVPFGFYWQMLHDRSGDVVGDGFSRTVLPRLTPRAGYSYRITCLHSARPWEVPCPV